MSVHRQLVNQQATHSYSTESAWLIDRIDTLRGELTRMVSILPEVIGDTVSMESSNVLSELGYSTEAGDGKNLLQRIWEGIKRIAASIKQYLSRLLAGRKHHLADNQLGIEKLRHYVKNLDMASKPEGDVYTHCSLLPDAPAEAHSKIHLLTDNIRTGMEIRNKALTDLTGMDFKTITKENVLEKIHSVVNRSNHLVSARSDTAGISFSFLVDKMGFEWIKGKGGNSDKVAPASLVMMNSLLSDYDKLVKDDNKFADEITKHSADSDKMIADIGKIVDEINKEAEHVSDDESSVEAWQARRSAAYEKVAAMGQMSKTIAKIQHITHIYMFDILYSDIVSILRASLGAYKMKKHELHPDEQK